MSPGLTQKFVRWYNQEHKHSGLKFVTPAQRHNGVAAAVARATVKPFMQRPGAQSTALVPIDAYWN